MRAAYHRGEVALGEKVRVHTINRGTEESMRRQADNARRFLARYLERNFALGLFTVTKAPSPDPLGGYDIFVAYWGEAKTPQRKGMWKAQRRRKRRVSNTAAG